MGTHISDVKPEKTVDCATPVNPETMPEQLPIASDAERASKHSKDSVEKVPEKEPFNPDAEPEYPSTRRVIPIVAALYMSFFLVALVSRSQSSL